MLTMHVLNVKEVMMVGVFIVVSLSLVDRTRSKWIREKGSHLVLHLLYPLEDQGFDLVRSAHFFVDKTNAQEENLTNTIDLCNVVVIGVWSDLSGNGLSLSTKLCAEGSICLGHYW
jgi:hypothetical protein